MKGETELTKKRRRSNRENDDNEENGSGKKLKGSEEVEILSTSSFQQKKINSKSFNNKNIKLKNGDFWKARLKREIKKRYLFVKLIEKEMVKFEKLSKLIESKEKEQNEKNYEVIEKYQAGLKKENDELRDSLSLIDDVSNNKKTKQTKFSAGIFLIYLATSIFIIFYSIYKIKKLLKVNKRSAPKY